nr:MAG TPA: hypothetical protein [Caudoviricetes sp.]
MGAFLSIREKGALFSAPLLQLQTVEQDCRPRSQF